MNPLEALTRAVLYEGYLLWPYRPSALKNRRRWTLGGVFPADWSRAHPDDPWRVRAECLAELPPMEADGRLERMRRRRHRFPPGRFRSRPRARPAPSVFARVRFLRAVGEDGRIAEEDIPFGPFPLVEGREIAPAPFTLSGGAGGHTLEGELRIDVSAAAPPDDERAGASGPTPRIATCRDDLHLVRVCVEIANLTRDTRRDHGVASPMDREAASRLAFLSLHIVLRVEHAAFVSLTDPPERWREAASYARQGGLWPVLIGEPGARSTILAAPIILPDYPRIAPESGGDFFDSTEIDQMLLLNVLALSDEEREQMRAGDPLARRILERALALDPEGVRAVHGTLRDASRSRVLGRDASLLREPGREAASPPGSIPGGERR